MVVNAFHERDGDERTKAGLRGPGDGHRSHDDPPPPPVLFETMVLGESDHAGKASKARTLTEARQNHARWLRVLQAEANGLPSDEAQADPSLEELFGLLGLLLEAPQQRVNGKPE
jgi:hypothetical protein